MDNKELERIYNDTYRSVYWTAMSLLKNEADAEDIVQETFVTLIGSYDTLKDKDKAAAWLKKTAANKCLDRLRRTKTVNAEDDFFENVEAQPEDFLPDSILESAEKRRIIMDIIDNALSEDIKRTLVLYYFDEMTTKEIASLLDIPQGTVLWRLNFAKKKIKKEVEKYEEENHDKLGAMAVPFLTKLFAKEAEQVPLKPIAASLMELTASAQAPAHAATTAKSIASSAAKKKVAGIALNKLIIGAVALVLVGTIATVVVITNSKAKKEDTVEETETEYSETAKTEAAVVEETEADDSASALIGTWVQNVGTEDKYITFYEDGTMDLWRVDTNGIETSRATGTYTVDGNNLTVTTSDGDNYDSLTYTIEGDTLSVTNPEVSHPFVYTRVGDAEAASSAGAGTAGSSDSAAALIGTWSITEGDNVMYMTFNEDGTLVVWSVNAVGQVMEQETDTYTVEGNSITVTLADGSGGVMNFAIDGDTMTVGSPDYPGQDIVLTRTDDTGSQNYTPSDLAGTWVSVSSGAHIWMTFNEDGTVEAWAVDANGNEMDRMTDTYSIEGNQLTLVYPNGRPSQTYDITIDGDTLMMALPEQPDFIYEYIRQ